MPALKVLILGGTTEAAALATELIARHGERVDVVSSFAGRVEGLKPPPGRIRIGGFGGTAGLAAYLAEERIDAVVDATHPFAAQMSRNAREAAALAGVPRLLFWRVPWPRHPLDRWIEVDSIEAAAQALVHLGRRVWLTVGASELAPFAAVSDRWYLVRVIEAKAPLPLPDCMVIEARGPFRLENERALIRHHRIEAMVSKASGGRATYAKIEAAREADLPVVMVRRPLPEPGERVAEVGGAADWVSSRL
ncbi:MAG: cobalt-precorrin-6A reductase [Alphaproteobacteria bacterium]|nr:cobalt-precorrin-6A reductase [Alphaproteobacteria bacterium]